MEEIPNEPISPSQPESPQPDPVLETNPIPTDVGRTPPSARDPLVALPGAAATPASQTPPLPPAGRFDFDAYRSIMGRPVMQDDPQIA